MKKDKKFNPIKPEPEDNVGTIYCDNTATYEDVKQNDMFPYLSPLPRNKRYPEPPII